MHVLPLVFPPIETYQGSSFILGILLANPNYSDIQYNGYINLQYNKEAENFSWLAVSFTDSTWDDYRVKGLAEMNLYDIAHFTKSSLVSFFRERLDQGCYLLLYDVDEYYLSNGEKYKTEHFNHDTYIYGYSDDSFLVLAYKNEHLERLVIKNEEVIESLFSEQARKNDDQRRHFSSFRLVINKGIKLDADIIRRSIKEFYEPDSEENEKRECARGIGVYDKIIFCLKGIKENEHVDMRAFKVIWEQKELMVNRIKKTFPELSSDCSNSMQSICDKIKLIFRIVMKYNHSMRKNSIERVCRLIDEVKNDDLKWYEAYFKGMCY